MRIEHVALNVKKPHEMAKWYCEQFGMKIAFSTATAYFLADEAGNILEIYNNPPERVPDYAAMDPLILHIAFASDDLAADHRRLLAAGATPVGPGPTDNQDFGLFMLRDPWGLAIQLARRKDPLSVRKILTKGKHPMKREACRTETQVVGRIKLNYLLYMPETKTNEADLAIPLLVFLHGAGERGDDLELAKKHGPPKLVEQGREFPFAVAAPQCPAGEWWEPRHVNAVIDHVVSNHRIDKTRIYLTGLSMGGYGTWVTANDKPERFAAIAPFCGPFAWIDAQRFKDLPVWCFHGAMDQTVSVGDSVRMVRTIREAGGNARFTVLADAAHDCWTQAYEGPELYDWFMQYARK